MFAAVAGKYGIGRRKCDTGNTFVIHNGMVLFANNIYYVIGRLYRSQCVCVSVHCGEQIQIY